MWYLDEEKWKTKIDIMIKRRKSRVSQRVPNASTDEVQNRRDDAVEEMRRYFHDRPPTSGMLWSKGNKSLKTKAQKKESISI